MPRDFWAIAIMAFGLAAWFIAGDMLFPVVTLGKVGFSLVPALVFGFIALRETFT